MGKTASELMSELEKDASYKLMKSEKDEKMKKLRTIYDNDEKLLVKELRQAGFSIDSVWDFVNSDNYYLEAESILVEHLKFDHHPRILSGIVRSLAIQEFSKNNELWELLVELYRKTPSDSLISVPEKRGLQEAIAIALECLSTDSRVESLKQLINEKPNGDCIDLLESRLKYYTNLKQ